MKRLLYGTTTAQGNDTTSATNALIVRNSAGNVLLGITNDGAVRVGTNSSATTQTTSSIVSSGSGTNIGLALVPKGNGALTAQIPDGTATGGNARGQFAVDLQRSRSAATDVASGNLSVISGGEWNTASGNQSTVSGGNYNRATNIWTTISGGGGNSASGTNSTVSGGLYNASTGSNACVSGGTRTLAYLYNQRAVAGFRFGSGDTPGNGQTSDIRYGRSITGTAITELTLDTDTPSAGNRAVLSLPTGATAGRVWNAKIQLIAVCTVQGAGTVTVGEVFGGNYAAIIKRIGTATSLVGTVQNLHTAQTDTNMATAAVTITADDTNESLKIEFTPPTTAAADTVIRVVATVYLTEVGY